MNSNFRVELRKRMALIETIIAERKILPYRMRR